MADKQLLLKQNAEDGFFADDDPLAALALIASFDPQGESRPRPSNQRREPEFNLEDELLKEFEQFEDPSRSAPPIEVAAESHSAFPDNNLFADDQPVAEIEPVAMAAPEPEPIRVEDVVELAPPVAVEPRRETPVLHAVPEPRRDVPVEKVRPVSHPVFDLEDEILREFAAFDAKKAVSAPAVPVVAEVAAIRDAVRDVPPAQVMAPVPQPAPVEPAPLAAAQPMAAIRQEPVLEDLPEVDLAESHAAYSGYDDDLAVEAELSPEDVVLDAPALDAMEAEVDPVRWQETKEPIVADANLLPVAKAVEEIVEEPVQFDNGQAGQDDWPEEIVHDEPAASPIAAAKPVEFEEYGDPVEIPLESKPARVFEPLITKVSEPVAAPQPEPAVAPVAVAPIVVAAPVVAAAPAPVAARKDDFGLDALLADAERYPVISRQRSDIPPAQRPSAVAPVSAPPVAAPSVDMPVAVVPAVAAPVEEAIRKIASSVAAPAVEPVVRSAIPPLRDEVKAPAVAPAKAAQADAHSHDAFDDGAFELDLSEIELDMLEMEVESSVAPSLHQDHITASQAALADMVEAAVVEKPAPTLVLERTFAPLPRPAEDYSSLPFDPSQVTTEEDPLEALADMDVPEAPVVEHDVPVAAQPDYDIDIDAEMAHIFSRPAEPEPRAQSYQGRNSQPAAATATVAASDLDEFERALEEDFRRSLSENRVTTTPDRVALTPEAYEVSRRSGATGRRLMVLAASVAGIVLIGGAGVYAYWGNPSKILSTSSEPKIILADKDPVKVAPKDRGGQIVPNQDKAVYDRVSGDDKDVAKQDRLVTSNEEPVDVVQKTLMPETLPMDDEDQASATDTSDTTDPRLLPEGQDKNISTTEKVVSGVSPRKVRTMVVRSDGTLVPRDEEPAKTTDTKQATTDKLPERSLDVTPPVTEEVPERLTANDDIAKQIKEAASDDAGTNDTKSFVPSADKTVETADAKPVTAEEVKALETQTQADDQAVNQDQPAAKTEEKPVVTEAAPVKQDDTTAAVTQVDNTATADNTATTDKVAAEDNNADEVASDTTVAEVSARNDKAALNEAANADVEVTAPIRSVKTTKITANTPIPENRPVDQPVDIVGTVTDQGTTIRKTQEVANADPVQQPVDNTQTTTPSGAYVIQIASLPSAAEAQKSYTKLSAKFSSVIGGHAVDIRKAAIKNKGTYYRVRIVAGSRTEAADLCSRYKALGGSCLVSK